VSRLIREARMLESRFLDGHPSENQNEENGIFEHFLLIFYCYLLIPLNELGGKFKNINELKNDKIKITIETIGTIKKNQKGGFCFLNPKHKWLFWVFQIDIY